MKRLCFGLTLLEDVVLTERSQSTGAAGSLDYIPGAVFLGVVAGRYSDFKEEAFAVFHSGSVRFGNAYPVAETGEPALPAPLCWHYLKGTEFRKNNTGALLDAEMIFNLAHNQVRARFDEWQKNGKQAKQIRNGYFALSGAWMTSQTGFRLKTAIDRTKNGRSAKAQLFGYESLSAGSRWYFDVEMDDGVSSEAIDRIKEALSDRIILGKSRSAEYGAAQCSPDVVTQSLPAAKMQDSVLRLYMLSDLALRDNETGLPTLNPDPRNFGVEKDIADFLVQTIKFRPDMSYLRSRSYAPFNGKRRAFDLERQVLVKGGVITMEAKKALANDDIKKLEEIFGSAIGYYRHDGLGKVVLNPEFLSTEHPVFRAKPIQVFALSKHNNVQSDGRELGKWLTKRRLEHDALVAAREKANKLLQGLAKACMAPGDKKRPSASQWRQVASSAMKSKDIRDLRKKLFGDKGICDHGISKEQWHAPIKHQLGDKPREVLHKLAPEDLKDGENILDFNFVRYLLYHLGVEMPKALRKEKGDE